MGEASPAAARPPKEKRNRRPGAVTAIDFDGQNVRVAHATRNGEQTILQSVGARAVPPPKPGEKMDPANLGVEIRLLLDQLKIKPGVVVMGMPRTTVALRALSVPPVDKQSELAAMVHFQINKDLPFRADEAVVDFAVQSEIPIAQDAAPGPEGNSSPKLAVMGAIVRREAVEFYQKAAESASIGLSALGWLPEANLCGLDFCGAIGENEAMAVVSVRPDEIGIDVVQNGRVLFSRGAVVPLPAPGDASPGPFIEAISIELVRSLHSYSGLSLPPPVSLLVTGSTGHEKAVADAVQSRVNLASKVLDASALGSFAGDGQAAAGSLSAIGLATGMLAVRGLSLDFVNPKRPPVQRNMQRLRWMAAAAVFSLLFFCVVAARSQLIRQRTRVNAQVQAELSAAEKKRPIYKQMRQQVTTVQNWSKDNRDLLEQYAFLSEILPAAPDIYVTSISLGSQKVIRLAVQAQSGEVLARLDRQLRAAGYEVKPLAVTPGTDKFGYNFRTTFEITTPEKMKIDLARNQAPARPANDGSLDPVHRGGAR